MPCSAAVAATRVEPDRLARVVGVRDDQRHVDAVRQQHLEAAHADVVVGEDDGARHGERCFARRRVAPQSASGRFEHRAHHVARALAHLLVDAPDVLADEAQAEQQHADQEEREDVAVPQQRAASAAASRRTSRRYAMTTR